MRWRPRRLAHTSCAMILMSSVGASCSLRPATSTPAVAERLQVIRRTWSAPDSTLRARSQGRLVVVIRSVDLPVQVLGQARVQLAVGDNAKAIVSANADSVGAAAFDALNVGSYRVTVSRLGYVSAVFTVPVESGCRTVLEVYLGMSFLGIAPPPPTPARAVVTLCPAGDLHRP